MKKYYNVYVDDREKRDNLCDFLRSLLVNRFEVSGCFDGYHFEMELTEEQKIRVDHFIGTGFPDCAFTVCAYYGKNYSGLAETFPTWSEDLAREKVWDYSLQGFYCIVESADGEERFTPDEVLDECAAYCEHIGEPFFDPRKEGGKV